MILYHGYAVRALNPAYRHEAEFVDADGSRFPLSDAGEKIDVAAVPGEQLLLMPLPEASEPPPIQRTKAGRRKKTGHAGVPGQGPPRETCGGCASYRSVRGGARVHPKCELTRANWTHGPGSDIRKSDPACQRWEAKHER